MQAPLLSPVAVKPTSGGIAPKYGIPVNQFDGSNETSSAWVFWSIYLIELTGYHWLDNQCSPPAGQAGGR